MKILISILILFTFTIEPTDNNCDKCDIEKVKIAYENIDSLTIEIISDFLCTFDESCNNNVEFSEWSNEILFKVIIKSPKLFIEVISKGELDNNKILKEIENPIHDLIDLQETYNKLKTASFPSEIQSRYLNSIIIAAEKGGQKILK